MTGYVVDLWYSGKGKSRVGKARQGVGKRWQCRWLDPEGNQHTKAFDNKDMADSYLATFTVDKLQGSYIDPKAGKISLSDYSSNYFFNQRSISLNAQLTQKAVWDKHIEPHLGARQLAEINASIIRAWLGTVQQSITSIAYLKKIRGLLKQVLESAVEDEFIVKNPLTNKTTKLPATPKVLVQPWNVNDIQAIYDALPDRHRIAILLGIGLGLRQGEVFGLSVEDINFLKREVTIRHGVRKVWGKKVFALPKGKKERVVPLPESLSLQIAAYINAYPPKPVTLPFDTPDGKLLTLNLIYTGELGSAGDRSYFDRVWKRALGDSGVGVEYRKSGSHKLRHSYASLFLVNGGNIRDLAGYLGHGGDPGWTLKTYTHVMDSNADRNREIMDIDLSGHKAVTKRSQMRAIERNLRQQETP
jgi:integrase